MSSLIILSILLVSVAFASGDISGLIIGGRDADRKQFPFQAGLKLRPDPSKTDFKLCGGALISYSHVITAAQCLEDCEEAEIILGDIYHESSSTIGRKTFKVNKKNFVIHHNWDGINNDIALIKLPMPVKSDDYTRPIQLPKNVTPPKDYTGRRGIVSGWGYTSSKGGVSDVLKYTYLEVISNYKCTHYHKELIKGATVCGSPYKHQNICHGDIGGPLVLNEDSGPTLIGLASYITPTCDLDTPAVFTRVTSFLDWIQKKTDETNA